MKERLKIQCRAIYKDCPRAATHERQSWCDPERWFPACEMHAKVCERMGLKTRELAKEKSRCTS